MRFPDFPEFRPNVSPRKMFRGGAFGGTYWRPIRSAVTGRDHARAHNGIAALRGIPPELLTATECEPRVNKFKVASGTSLEYWEERGWIVAQDPYGWVQWYCRFAAGRRTPDDARQVQRWLALAGPRGRFRRSLVNKVKAAGTSAGDPAVSPRTRQTLWQWGIRLVPADLR